MQSPACRSQELATPVKRRSCSERLSPLSPSRDKVLTYPTCYPHPLWWQPCSPVDAAIMPTSVTCRRSSVVKVDDNHVIIVTIYIITLIFLSCQDNNHNNIR